MLLLGFGAVRGDLVALGAVRGDLVAQGVGRGGWRLSQGFLWACILFDSTVLSCILLAFCSTVRYFRVFC